MYLEKVWWESVFLVQLSHDSDQWRTSMNTVIIVQVP
jgi:hypothetical protein